MKKYKQMLRALCLVSLISIVLVGCKAKEEEVVKVAKQYGLAYAPIQIMMDKGFLEEELGDSVQIEWVQLANTAAIREAMLGNSLDIGFVGIPPFLIGYEAGMEWKIMTGLNQSPVGMVTASKEIESLEDIKSTEKIALPQPGSIQHILLAMEAKKRFGVADYYDKQLISMKHPDGMQALLSGGDIVAHFTSPPYFFKESDAEGGKVLITGKEAMGEEFTFIVGICRENFATTTHYSGFLRALKKSMKFIQDEPEETVKILAKEFELEEAVIEDYIYHRGMIYSEEVLGLEKFLHFMEEEGYLKEKYTVEELEYKK